MSHKNIENYEEITCVAYGEISTSKIEVSQNVLESNVYETVQ